MKWGSHKAEKVNAKLDKKIASSNYRAETHAAKVANFEAIINDIEKNGTNSAQFQKEYGRIANKSDAMFYALTGQSKALALARIHSDAMVQRNHHAKYLNKETARGKELASRKVSLDHDGMNAEAYLQHHGVKGMKWGVRKGSSESHHETASADHILAEQHKATIRTSGVKALSNEELQKLVTRLNLEKQHRDLVGQAPSKVDRGHKHVKKVLSIAKTVSDIYNTANSPAGKALKTALKK